jgi:chromosome segregation ATPase
MKNFLQNLLIFFALCLCGLIAVQWVRETDLNKRMQALTNDLQARKQEVLDLQAASKRDAAEIKRLGELKDQLTALVKSNQVDIARLTKDLEKVSRENEHNRQQMEAYKVAFEKEKENVLIAQTNINELGEQLKIFASQRNLAVTNLNTISKTITDIASRWGKMAEDYGKAKPDAQREMAANNMNQMTKDFNDLVVKWNDVLQQLQRSTPNSPGSSGPPPTGTNASPPQPTEKH